MSGFVTLDQLETTKSLEDLHKIRAVARIKSELEKLPEESYGSQGRNRQNTNL